MLGLDVGSTAAAAAAMQTYGRMSVKGPRMSADVRYFSFQPSAAYAPSATATTSV
jgi:hypothetical protein